MFKSAATRIAHNTTIPSFGGNPDLRPLQDLITAEKAVLISFQRLSTDVVKAAEALRVWGAGEGDDLNDILGASNALLAGWSNALTAYASLGHTMRDQLKSIRTREENLDELKRRRKNLGAKAESAEKKVSKMGPEHKHLQVQVETLNSLRAEIRSLDSEIMSEEAFLGDFKRTTTKSWMSLKFGGMLECCDKGSIAGEYGKLVIAEIPEETTQPGMARSLYHGRRKTEALLSEAHRQINEVKMSTAPASQPLRSSQDSIRDDNNHPRPLSAAGTGYFPDQPWTPVLSARPIEPPYPQLVEEEAPRSRSFDDFGVNVSGSSYHTGSGALYATFPVKRTGPAPLSLDYAPRSGVGESFSSSVTEALRSSQSPPGPLPFSATATPQPHQLFAPPPGPPPGMQAQLEADERNIAQAQQPYAPLAYMDDSQREWATHHHEPTYEQPVEVSAHGTPHYDPRATQDHGPGYQPQHAQPSPPRGPRNSISARSQELPEAPAEGGGSSPTRFQNQRRIPVPAIEPGDWRGRDAAAARELGRELEALGPVPSPIAIAQLRNAGQRSRDASPTRGLPAAAEQHLPDTDDDPPLPAASRPWADGQPRSRSSSLSRYATPANLTTSPLPPLPPSLSQEPSSEGQRNSPSSPRIASVPSTGSLSSSDQRLGMSLGNPLPSWLANKSTTALDAQVTQGTRTISAAAFRRQRMGTGPPAPSGVGGGSGSFDGAMADTSPLVVHKRGERREESPLGAIRRSFSSGFLRRSGSASRSREGSPRGSPSGRKALLPGQTPPPPVPVPGAREEFSYLGPYVESGMPQDVHHEAAGGVGYGAGRYATDLERAMY